MTSRKDRDAGGSPIETPDSEAAPDAELAHDLRVACMRLSRRLRMDASGLPPHLFVVLAAVEHEPRTATELAAAEQVTAASMSRTIAELEQRGLITRESRVEDRRTRWISLTEEGRRELLANRRQRDRWMRERLATCSDGERDTLGAAAAILGRFVEVSR